MYLPRVSAKAQGEEGSGETARDLPSVNLSRAPSRNIFEEHHLVLSLFTFLSYLSRSSELDFHHVTRLDPKNSHHL